VRSVLVNGVFDCTHPGHIALLNYARQQGDSLTVAIDSDQRVRRNKGPGRPVNSQSTRKLLLENLRAVDRVVVFSSDSELIQQVLHCDVTVKGSDYQYQPWVGQDLGVEVIWFDRIAEYSTTATIQRVNAGVAHP
jgi:D-beta-D-heptose 7-phosphate kinase / D-beta-D-heptose 1-phosphate adenosyltransferase